MRAGTAGRPDQPAGIVSSPAQNPPRTRTNRRSRAGLVLAGLIAVVLTTGCGLAQEDRARVIDAEAVPYDLAGDATRDAPVFDRRLDLRPVTVYLVEAEPNGERYLVPRQRLIPDPVNLSTVVGNLMAGGVTPEERSERLVNQVPGGELRAVERTAMAQGSGPSRPDPSGPVAVVDVGPGFFERFPTGAAQRLAIGQIVLTITGYRPASGAAPVSQVRFTVGNRERLVPTGDPEQPMQAVVGAADYAALQGAPAAVGTVTVSTAG